jgi:Ca2+-binding RTX toxin-like protein
MSSYNPGNAFKETSGYGARILLGRPDFHPGIDFAAPVGTDIPAASSGTVWYSGYNGGGYGYTVIIKSTGADEHTYYTLYAHMNGQNMPSLNDVVDQGDTIGEVGLTGKTTGPHLHFEVLTEDATINHAAGGPLGVTSRNQAIRVDPAIFDDWADSNQPYGSGNSIIFGSGGSGGPEDISDQATGNLFSSNFTSATFRISPIILDLNGDGVSTLAKDAGVYFDLRNTGFTQATGWVAPTDGLLAWDRNSNGVIDNGGELFGNFTNRANNTRADSGFDALATYDDNTDNVIDSNDAIWSDLKIWIDANSNGITDSGELHTLDDLGVQSLNLVYGGADGATDAHDENGNNHAYLSYFTRTNSTIGGMNDVNFITDNSDTVPDSWVETTSAIDALPDLPGQGTLYSLHQAMARDTSGTLQDYVEDFVNATTVVDRNTALQQILIYWTGTESVSSTSRDSNGSGFDAQQLAILEAVLGTPFKSVVAPFGDDPNDPYSFQDAHLNVSWFTFFESTYAQLAAQTFLKPFYDEITTVTDSSGIHFDFTDVLDDLFNTSRTSTEKEMLIEEFYRTVFASGIPDAQVGYAGLLSALATGASAYVSDVNDIVAPYYEYNMIPGAGPNDETNYLVAVKDGQTILCGLGGSTVWANYSTGKFYYNTTVYGNAGTNTINARGDMGIDKIYGGTGDDTIRMGGTLAAGTIIDGGAGDNTLSESNWQIDISQGNISNIQTLDAGGSTITLTSDQFSAFSTIDVSTGFGGVLFYAASGGTYDLSAQNIIGTVASIYATDVTDEVTLIGNDFNSQALGGGAGITTLTAGDGTGDILIAGSGTTTMSAGTGGDTLYDGQGVDTMNGGIGDDAFVLNYATAGTVINGSNEDKVVASSGSVLDISGVTINNVDTLEVNGHVQMTHDQFNQMTTLTTTFSGGHDIVVTEAGAYSLAGKSATGWFNLIALYTNEDVTLIGNDQDNQTLRGGGGTTVLSAGDGANDILIAESGNTTMNAGAGGDTLYDGYGVATMNGGSGVDTFYVNYATAGTVINGGTEDTLQTSSNGVDLTVIDINGVETLDMGGNVTLTAAQLDQLATISADDPWWSHHLFVSAAGTYDLSGKTITGYVYGLDASQTSENVTLIGSNRDGQTLKGGSGTTVLTAGDGIGDVLIAGSGATTLNAGSGGDTLYDGEGINILNGGSGDDTFYVNFGTSGTVINGSTEDKVHVPSSWFGAVDLSVVDINGVNTLELDANVKLTADQFDQFTDITESEFSGNHTLYASNAGTYDLSGKTTTGNYDLDASQTDDDVTLIGNDQDNQSLTGGAGDDTLIAGTGLNVTLNSGVGNDTMTGNNGDTSYGFGYSFGEDTINNVGTSGATAHGEISFNDYITSSNLWFEQVGNNLQIDLLGTLDHVTVNNWFGSNAAAQVSSINTTGDSMHLDSQVAQLVQAMATYATNNSGFNPTSATSMPTDTTLQTALAASWHS